jgi:hypothetical protein
MSEEVSLKGEPFVLDVAIQTNVPVAASYRRAENEAHGLATVPPPTARLEQLVVELHVVQLVTNVGGT